MALNFGTSGLRGLVSELLGPPAYAYSRAFARMLAERAALNPAREVLIGRDLRQSSPAIARLCAAALADEGLVPIDCGPVPTPALALSGAIRQAPAIMVTGSHIPEDRNGLKFYLPGAEIDKADEARIVALHAEIDAGDPRSNPQAPRPDPDPAVVEAYVRRYLDFFGAEALAGLRVGVYQHSAVGRDVMVEVITRLGGTPTALGRADHFIPVDTEALRPEDVEALAQWARDDAFDAIVSSDGDADRPLVADGAGQVVHGDLLGAITARRLGADAVVTPVTSNSALEAAGFARVLRTRVGSPYVIAGMAEARAAGARRVVGFEANGGVLLGSDIDEEGRILAALPTRDAVLPIVAALSQAASERRPLAAIAREFAFNAGASNRLKAIPSALSGAFLARLGDDAAFRDTMFSPLGPIARTDAIDGVRVGLASGETVHFRASGNAPELRCYVEAATNERAQDLLAWGLAAAQRHMERS